MNEFRDDVILLVDDDRGHARLIEKYLARMGIAQHVIWLDNGRRALDFIFEEGEFQGVRTLRPCLVIADLNMPETGGVQVLSRLKGDGRTSSIAVAILTTSDNPAEMEVCRQLGCDAFLRKPMDSDGFTQVAERIASLVGGGMIKIVE
jgi:CheY-like chemotaxis protein